MSKLKSFVSQNKSFTIVAINVLSKLGVNGGYYSSHERFFIVKSKQATKPKSSVLLSSAGLGYLVMLQHQLFTTELSILEYV